VSVEPPVGFDVGNRRQAAVLDRLIENGGVLQIRRKEIHTGPDELNLEILS